jgi:hypothetical protein
MAAQIREQTVAIFDSRLNTLVSLTRTMHSQAVAIGNELRDQLTIAGDLNDRMDKTKERLDTLNGTVHRLRIEDNSCLLL